MKQKEKVTKKEIEILKEHRKKCGTALIRDRAHAILLNTKGYGEKQISDILDRKQETIENWFMSWNEIRIASIFPKYEENENASKLTKEQQEEIKNTLINAPSENGIPNNFWTLKTLREYISARYGVIYESDRLYHHLFEITGFSFKLPEGMNHRRDDDLVKKRMKEIMLEIEEKQKEKYIIFAGDECSLCFATIIRKAWIKKGEKTIIRTESEKKRQHYFGALNLVTKKHELISLNWQDTENMIDALRELKRRYGGKKICIIWDNARWHRAKELRKLLGKGNEFEHIHLIWLPPYAPDENPEEHVWKIGKNTIANTVTHPFDDLKHLFESAISNKYFNYQI